MATHNVTGILLSGGLDSTAIAFWLRPQVAFTVDYGQRSAGGEIRAARAICRELSIAHEVLTVDCRALGSGDLVGSAPATNAPGSEWWPFRNQLLVTLAAMRGYALGINRLLVGSVASDSYHTDGTREFYDRLDRVLGSQEGGIRVEAPAIHLKSEELIRHSQIPIEMLAWTHSCYRATFACGNCRACWKRMTVLKEVGFE